MISESTNTVEAELVEKMKRALVNIGESMELEQRTVGKDGAIISKQAFDGIKRKHVEFAAGTDSTKNYTPLAHSKKKKIDQNKTIIDLWIRLSQKKEYEKLHNLLFSDFHMNESTIADFFSHQGYDILMRAILWGNSESLEFLIQTVPMDALRAVLRQNNYSVVNSLLSGYTCVEKIGNINLDPKTLERGVEKFKLLLKVDCEGLKNYVDSDYFENSFLDRIKTNFRQAVSDYRSQPSFLKND